MVCLQNLRKTFKYGGRKNVPSIEEISAISVSVLKDLIKLESILKSNFSFVQWKN